MRALVILGFACLAPACSTPAANAGDAGDDAALDGDANGCLFCNDAGPEPDASLGARAYARLLGCNGIDRCHVSGAANLTFPPGNEAAQVIGVPAFEWPSLARVKPFDPEASYLYLKVLGDGGIEGGRMPLGSVYDPRVPALFLAWIEAGAPPP